MWSRQTLFGQKSTELIILKCKCTDCESVKTKAPIKNSDKSDKEYYFWQIIIQIEIIMYLHVNR